MGLSLTRNDHRILKRFNWLLEINGSVKTLPFFKPFHASLSHEYVKKKKNPLIVRLQEHWMLEPSIYTTRASWNQPTDAKGWSLFKGEAFKVYCYQKILHFISYSLPLWSIPTSFSLAYAMLSAKKLEIVKCWFFMLNKSIDFPKCCHFICHLVCSVACDIVHMGLYMSRVFVLSGSYLNCKLKIVTYGEGKVKEGTRMHNEIKNEVYLGKAEIVV